MAIYGINFNRTAIPVEVSRRFKRRIRLSDARGDYGILQGVADTSDHWRLMMIQATNGHRRLCTARKRINGVLWHAIYVG